jgi:CheY-like chemotaxis protein
LDFRVVPTEAWVRSDFVLLEQILLNLVSNAVRYAARGGVLIGARKRGRDLRIEIWDTGPGIPDDQREKIFSEFYRGDDPQHDRRELGGGLGLGLAIVDRMCRLLHHPIELSSDVGHGSRFSVIVPMAAATAGAAEPPPLAVGALNLAAEKFIVVIDDDALALDGMGGLLRSWGCHVVAARSAAEALLDLAEAEGPPDIVISDFHLSDQCTGIEAIEQLRAAFGAPIPAFLISGDIGPALRQQAQRGGYHLLHKPVDPMPLRTMLNRLLKKRGAVDAGR